MLSLVDRRPGYGRREFLRVGGLSLGGMSLSHMLQAKAEAASTRRGVKDKSVIFLFMHGGPSQIETFDPKMTAPDGVRSATGEISTAIPGITFGSTYEKLAQRAKDFSIVRSYATGDAKHDIKPIVGEDSLKANIGSLYAKVAGINHPETGMPTNCALFPRAINPQAQPAQEGFGKFWSTGTLGTAYMPFIPGGGGQLQDDMKLSLAKDRLDDRRSLLSSLDRIQRNVDASGMLQGIDRFQEQAFATILGGVADAFDLKKEDPHTVAKYDTNFLMTPDQINRKLNNHKFYVDHVQTLDKLLLTARRLCEAGCGFVTVTTNFVWDNHADVNNAGVSEGMKYCGLAFDHAVSAFIDDCRERGLTDKILLVCTGEMGRTPRINKNGGRDHWGNLTPLLLSGGGLPMGKVIGQSTRDAGEPLTDKVTSKNLIATIMHTLFDSGELRVSQGVPLDISRVIFGADPIVGLS